MQVEIAPLGFLRVALGRDMIVLHLETGQTVRDVLAELEIRRDLVATVVINDATAAVNTVLQEGDRVKLLPYTGGG
jgi:molybdopterin converting factor small subunit